jgi:signal transduction histidine kinase
LPNPEAAVGKTDFDCLPHEEAEAFFAAEQELLAQGTEYDAEEKVVDAKTGKTRWLRTTKVALRDGQGRIMGLAGINRDITERKKWEAELESLHRQLMEASRHAGMAEVAISVLHNVGNVLNSVNVSASLVAERIKDSAAVNLDKVVSLLRENEGGLPEFLAHHPRGRHLVGYLQALADHLGQERVEMLSETDQLRKNVEHIKEIVAMQQANAKAKGVAEIVQPAELFEDALRMHGQAYTLNSVKVIREYGEVPRINVDRHKVLQILINLLQNAKQACEANDPGTGR